MNSILYYPSAFCFLLSLSVLVIIAGGVLLSVVQNTDTYDVFGTEVSSMSGTNQTLQHNVPLSYEQNISAEFPFESNFVEVLGSKMHYVEKGGCI
jgi:hypothetical protein